MDLLLRKYLEEVRPKIEANKAKNNSAGPQPAVNTTTTTPSAPFSTQGYNPTTSKASNTTSTASKTTSSGGASKSTTTNSPYTAPTLGNTYDANVDYQTIINSAVENGDYYTAAKAEQLRNQKILGMNMDYERTNTYGGYLDGTDIDLSIVGTNQMNNNASKEDVAETYWGREDKIKSSPDLMKYANDPVQQAMYQYVYGDTAPEYEEFEYDEERPTAPETDPRIAALLDQILNRGNFSYDAMDDPLYQQYAEMYRREGDRAMRETMAEAAASAGGMNTYAITAANQANNYYNSQLNDKIPELYQLAYQMYLNEKESEVQNLGLLQDMDATQYSRYRDTMSDWRDDRNFAYEMYRDDVQQGNWEAEYNRDVLTDNRDYLNNNIWKSKEWDNYISQQDLNNKRYDQEYADKQEQQAIENKRYDQEWENYIEQQARENGWTEEELALKKEEYYANQSWKEKEWNNFIEQQALENGWTEEQLNLEKSKFEADQSWKQTEWTNYLEQQALENGWTQQQLDLEKSKYEDSKQWKATEWENYLTQQARENGWTERKLTNDEKQQIYTNEQTAIAMAKDEAYTYIENGVMPSDDLINKAGMEKEYVTLLVEAIKKEKEESKKKIVSGGSSGGTSGSSGDDLGFEGDTNPITEETPEPEPEPVSLADKAIQYLASLDAGTETYQAVNQGCEELLKTEGKSAVLQYLKEAYKIGAINQSSYMTLYNKYRG